MSRPRRVHIDLDERKVTRAHHVPEEPGPVGLEPRAGDATAEWIRTPTISTFGGGAPLASAPTHPNQVGLAGIGRNRDTFSWPTVHTSSVTFGPEIDGTVIEDTLFEGTVNLDVVDTITFDRCWFQGNTITGLQRVSGSSAKNITVRDSDFGEHGAGGNIKQGGVFFLGNLTVERCLFYNMEDGGKLAGGFDTHIIDSWVQPVRPDADAHADCMQFNANVSGRMFVVRSTLDCRSWRPSGGGTRFHAQEELDQAAEREHAGNAVLEAGPCRPDLACDPPPSAETVFYSIVDSIVAGGNYLMTASNCFGEFLRNIVVRGSANPGVDLGIRNSANINRPSSGPDVSVFHDNGEVYTGGKVNPNGEADPGPIHLLDL